MAAAGGIPLPGATGPGPARRADVAGQWPAVCSSARPRIARSQCTVWPSTAASARPSAADVSTVRVSTTVTVTPLSLSGRVHVWALPELRTDPSTLTPVSYTHLRAHETDS